jgi:hypothetical protein
VLHVGQHQIHAQPGANAGTFQAEAGTSAGQNGGFACEIRDHAVPVEIGGARAG